MGKIAIGGSFKFNGCEISVNDGYTDLTMSDYMEKIELIPLTIGRRGEREIRATADEDRRFRRAAGILMFLGN